MAPRRVVLVLGAGRGERLGGPKALLLIEGVPLAVLHRDRTPERIVLVTRAAIAEKLAPFDLGVVISDAPDELGPAGSIHAAVAAGALDEVDEVLVTPVDVPPSPDAARLFAELGQHEAARFERGHPVAIRASILRERYRADAPILRDVLASLGDRCVRLPGSGAPDLDLADDVVRLTGRGPVFLR